MTPEERAAFAKARRLAGIDVPRMLPEAAAPAPIEKFKKVLVKWARTEGPSKMSYYQHKTGGLDYGKIALDWAYFKGGEEAYHAKKKVAVPTKVKALLRGIGVDMTAFDQEW